MIPKTFLRALLAAFWVWSKAEIAESSSKAGNTVVDLTEFCAVGVVVTVGVVVGIEVVRVVSANSFLSADPTSSYKQMSKIGEDLLISFVAEN